MSRKSLLALVAVVLAFGFISMVPACGSKNEPQLGSIKGGTS